MKSNYIRSKSETEQISRKAAREEIKRQMETFCPACQSRMEAQTIAVICKALNSQFGFGKKRLRDVIDSAEALGTMIHENGDNYAGAIEWLKKVMGIDLEVSK